MRAGERMTVDNQSSHLDEHQVVERYGHRVQIRRWTRGTGKAKYVTRCSAWCSCGFSTPTCTSNAQLDTHIKSHFEGEGV